VRIFFTSGRIIDGRGGMIERGSMLVEAEHIVAYRADVARPRDADRLIDLAGRTLIRELRKSLVAGYMPVKLSWPSAKKAW
jgi:hypothetical protein